MGDDELRMDVEAELYWEPRVDAHAIAVSAAGGVVTLRGTVGSHRERRETTSAVKRVYGVTGVDNQLEVKVLDDDKRTDADLRGAVLQALMLDSLVPSTIDATVTDGRVQLTGSVKHQYERDEAEFVAGNLAGVTGIDDHIELSRAEPKADDIEHSIKKAFKRDAKLDAKGVDVETSDGMVTLSGTVSSWSEHDAAVNAAWAAPGVSQVDDRLLVEY